MLPESQKEEILRSLRTVLPSIPSISQQLSLSYTTFSTSSFAWQKSINPGNLQGTATLHAKEAKKKLKRVASHSDISTLLTQKQRKSTPVSNGHEPCSPTDFYRRRPHADAKRGVSCLVSIQHTIYSKPQRLRRLLLSRHF